jgi:hypothetical protein
VKTATLPPGVYRAQARGICGECSRVIEAGELFTWRGDLPREPVCRDCRGFRVRGEETA